jgi:phage terminase large subunit-like protein
MPRARLQEHIKSDLAPYDIWEKEKLITVTGGVSDYKNDYMFIIQKLREVVEKHDLKLKGIGYDPHNADGFLHEIVTFGCPVTDAHVWGVKKDERVDIDDSIGKFMDLMG